jgi:hypothetical protein
MAYGSLLADVVQSSTAGTPPQFKDGNSTQIGTLCRAWVNFNGTGTVAIRASFNVSSITDNGTGVYTINLTTAMPDANYAVTCLSGLPASLGAGNSFPVANILASTVSGFQTSFTAAYGSASNHDMTYVNLAIFR